jgi:hypothetical protein
MAADIRAAVDHAEHLIGALLILARNERGLTVHEEVDLATVAEDVLDSAPPRSDGGLSVTVTIPSAGTPAQGTGVDADERPAVPGPG